MITRLWHWITRAKVLPDMDEKGYIPNKKRPPTFMEAITGISNS